MASVMTTNTLARLKVCRMLAGNGEGRRIRVAAGLSLRELSQAIEVDASTLARWETGATRPRTAAALRWEATLRQLSGPETQWRS